MVDGVGLRRVPSRCTKIQFLSASVNLLKSLDEELSAWPEWAFDVEPSPNHCNPPYSQMGVSENSGYLILWLL